MNCLWLILFMVVELSRLISFNFLLSAIRYIKMVGSMLSPDQKASSELLRGSILKIIYTDQEGEKVLLLPFSDQKKNWIKVTALVFHKLSEDIEERKIDEKKLQRKKVNITKEILKMAGPGKDFFNLPITPVMINRDYNQITFHYRNKANIKSFSNDEVITGLL